MTTMQPIGICVLIVVIAMQHGGTLGQRCNGQLYLRETHFCCGGHLYKKTKAWAGISCCTDEIYNPRTDFCCAGRLHKKPLLWGGVSCCIDFIYNPYSHFCCTGQLYTKPYGPAGELCCHDHIYNSSTHFCCYTNPNNPWKARIVPEGMRKAIKFSCY